MGKKKAEEQAPTAPVTEAAAAPEAPATDGLAETKAEPDTLSEIGKVKASASPLVTPVRDPKAGVKVRAKSDGFYNGALREKGKKSGEFYLLPGDKPAKWMEVIGVPKTEE